MNKKVIGLFLAVAMLASIVAGCTARPGGARCRTRRRSYRCTRRRSCCRTCGRTRYA